MGRETLSSGPSTGLSVTRVSSGRHGSGVEGRCLVGAGVLWRKTLERHGCVRGLLVKGKGTVEGPKNNGGGGRGRTGPGSSVYALLTHL